MENSDSDGMLYASQDTIESHGLPYIESVCDRSGMSDDEVKQSIIDLTSQEKVIRNSAAFMKYLFIKTLVDRYVLELKVEGIWP